jgi:hypothetical protein
MVALTIDIIDIILIGVRINYVRKNKSTRN